MTQSSAPMACVYLLLFTYLMCFLIYLYLMCLLDVFIYLLGLGRLFARSPGTASPGSPEVSTCVCSTHGPMQNSVVTGPLAFDRSTGVVHHLIYR